MIKVEHAVTWGWEHAIRGMRNPLNSWDKSDTTYKHSVPTIGENDLSLMKRLFKGGTEHRKYLRMIIVSMDITAPLYWWKEFDTYKVGTVANSCSTMHKIASKEFTLDDFSHEHLDTLGEAILINVIRELNSSQNYYNNYERYKEEFEGRGKKDLWWQMIQLLPTSYNQKRTVQMSYENVYTILRQRRGHKLDEWNELCDILSDLPYVKEIADETGN
jgi:hypothetical protein